MGTIDGTTGQEICCMSAYSRKVVWSPAALLQVGWTAEDASENLRSCME
jgi:hypothetical protein